MAVTRRAALLGITSGISAKLTAQQASEEFRVYRDMPRLLVTSNRKRLLQRERQRQSPRWRALEALLSGGARWPEPGFALALAHLTTGEERWAEQAAAWAGTAPQSTIRQVALVYDWCFPALNAAAREVCEKKLASALQPRTGPTSVAQMRDRVLAAVALADAQPQASAATLEYAVQSWWPREIVPQVQDGEAFSPPERYALFELLHAVRDNLQAELREPLSAYFKELPLRHLLSYYPAPLANGQQEYRIPYTLDKTPSDERAAVLARAAELIMIAYDNTAQESQFLQGWANNDRFVMRGSLGAPYEYLWANPYQPGLTYTKLPLALYDSAQSLLLLRSSWDEGAEWMVSDRGRVRQWRLGQVMTPTLDQLSRPVRYNDVLVLSSGPTKAWDVPVGTATCYVLGLRAGARYKASFPDKTGATLTADPGGVVEVPIESRFGWVRLQQAD